VEGWRLDPRDLRQLKLHEIAPFERLGAIAERLGLELILFGGTACRAAMHLTYASHHLDIFDLAPFSSDIDLEHSGDSDDTLQLLYAIQEEIPFASWFRWSINDKEKARKAAAARQRSTHVPLRQIRFSTHHAAEISNAAICDLARREVSLQRNPAFRDGVISNEHRDLELYGLMMALNAEAEMRDIAGDVGPTLRTLAGQWLAESGDELALAASDLRLAARFWALLAMQLARNGRDDTVTQRILELAQDHGVLGRFDVDPKGLAAPGHAFSLSKFTVAGDFRIPELSPEILTGTAARVGFGEALRDIVGRDGGDAGTLIDPAFELIAMLPKLTIKPYFGPDLETADENDIFQSGMEQEFVQIAWLHTNGPPLRAHGLTAQVVPWNLLDLATTSALPAVGGVFDGNRPWVRARLDDLVDRSTAGRDGLVSLLILQARGA